MKLLLIGGTRFVGRALATQALERGHRLTLLHRGRSNAALFPEADHRIADRDGDLSVLGNDTWDAVIDTCAYLPRQVRRSAGLLAGRVGNYQLVSTISVIADFSRCGLTEDAPVCTLPDPDTEVIDGETYGGLKALCELALREALPDRCDVVRPGLIVGPHDPTGRFTWWLERMQRGGDVLCPDDPSAPVQFIDARDLAAFMLDRVEAGLRGVVHATGPLEPLTMGQLLAAMRDLLHPGARLHWVDEALLLDQGVAPWTEMPLWVPRASAGLHALNLSRARADGLQCRPLVETLRDTLAWALQAAAEAPATSAPGASTSGPARPGVGLDPAREHALLRAAGRVA